jgi:Fe-S cluster assembly protein SufB
MGKSLANLKANYKSKYGFRTDSRSSLTFGKGLSEELVRGLSEHKEEPPWMLDYRLQAYQIFLAKDLPDWAVDISKLDLDDIHYFVKPGSKKRTWDEVPREVKQTFDRLGVPQAEREFLAGVEAQFDSEAVYGSLKVELEEQGIIFTDMDTALQKHADILKDYFGKIVPSADNKFAALNSAVWSGGSFVYIPKGVHVKRPLQAYFRINANKMGQFERTLIIADEGSFVHYVEGCTAPVYSEDSLHAAVVEVFVKPGARVRYSTIQNWSNNVYNLVTKRARVEKEGVMEWVDGNLGSKVTMKYPACYLVGRGAHGEVLSIAYASEGQNIDAGARMVHVAPNTTSKILSKSISLHGGNSTYRGLVDISVASKNAKSRVECDALILDGKSTSNTFPVMRINESSANVEHEAAVSKISEENLYYLTSRGLSAEHARSLIVSGFIEPIVKELPMEYAVELNQLIDLEMEGSVG